ncbi:DUF423 domain-containing protein [Psychrobium sp. 1_MG-2023]|uniref:DUF423 domain-containing protein n=1 Tax=Psychrobium sp. 1_MG-2023 TaxID=3062624 RepID=UPI000C324950|nr:DUF423 domain-containing protein [Psychrobium sp. 1_MG-2023]MDP2560933.1 DUF423 domain-containing protein [Psychrobium sp. 1_MG-2023]PKF56005.1 DUF423 domain-containing protein [Alteromonadales bacterium alter-6D02]
MTSHRVTRMLMMFAGLNGAFATAFAAYASHAEKVQQSAALVDVFNKANQHHYYALLAMLACVFGFVYTKRVIWLTCGILFALGISLFCYTLYLFAFTGVKIAGFLTPIGGMTFIVAWLGLLVAARTLCRESK